VLMLAVNQDAFDIVIPEFGSNCNTLTRSEFPKLGSRDLS